MATLTPTEHRLLHLLAGGRTNAQIGQHLQRSEKTVRNQLTHLYAKLGVANRTEAVVVYLRSGDAEATDRDIRPIANTPLLG